MQPFALRGAISVDVNDSPSILAATAELVRELMDRNDLAADRIVFVIFTVTDDLNADFPAKAARDVGLDRVPLLCAREIDVPGALPRVIRALVHYQAQDDHEPRHVYLGEARALREDLDSAQ